MTLGLGCANDVASSVGNAELGIATFQVAETASQTTVIGLDASGQEVGRLELVHGRFALTGIFKEDYSTPDVEGRKLDVMLDGEKKLVWETAGYAPVLHLPVHRGIQPELSVFLADPHVGSVLDRWQIGFDEIGDAAGEVELATGSYSGTNYTDCSGSTNCGTLQRAGGSVLTMNMCGGGYTSGEAGRVTRTTPDAEYLIGQCCPPGSGGGQSTNWFAIKACPTTSANNYQNTCGNASATTACKACPTYPMNAQLFCSVKPWKGQTLQYAYEEVCTSNASCQQFGTFYCEVFAEQCVEYDPEMSFLCPDGTRCEEQSTAGVCDVGGMACPLQ